MNELDALLSQPLPAVPDNGFSARVMARLQRNEQKNLALRCGGVLLAASVLCLLVPLAEFADAMNRLVLVLATSGQVALALLVAALTWIYDKKLYRWVVEAAS